MEREGVSEFGGCTVKKHGLPWSGAGVREGEEHSVREVQ